MTIKESPDDVADEASSQHSLKTLKGLTPYQYICQQWTLHPERFLFDPSHHTLGLYILGVTQLKSEIGFL